MRVVGVDVTVGIHRADFDTLGHAVGSGRTRNWIPQLISPGGGKHKASGMEGDEAC